MTRFLTILILCICSSAHALTLTNLSFFPRTNFLSGSNYFVIVQVANSSNTIVLVPVDSGLSNRFAAGLNIGSLNVNGDISISEPGAVIGWPNNDEFGRYNTNLFGFTVAGTTVVTITTNGAHGAFTTTVNNFPYASTTQIDRATYAAWAQTNRLTAAATFNITNIYDGQELSLIVPGEISGGTDRDITLTWPSGWFASYHLNTVTNGLTTLTVGAGETVEVNIKCGTLQGTNTARVVYGKYPR